MSGSVSSQLEPLRQLQTIDTELYRLRAQTRQKPLELEHVRQKVADQQVRAQTLEARLREIQMQHKAKELELSTKESNVKKLQGQLFQVKTNKEYSAMQHEIDQSKADISLLEEDILGLLDGIDQAKREHTAQLGLLGQQQQALQAEEARVEEELAQIREQLAQQQRQREGVLPAVPKDALSLYERILASREGRALVPLLRESCGGCNMVQPPQVVNEVHLKNRLVTCESCSRILYVDQNQSSG